MNEKMKARKTSITTRPSIFNIDIYRRLPSVYGESLKGLEKKPVYVTTKGYRSAVRFINTLFNH